MTVDETRDMLGDVADDLNDAEIDALCERTEGWAAAIRLAAISLESAEDPHRFIADFAADDRAISDYLLNEVLDQQPDDLRTFLLRTSLPDRLTAELAADLTDRPDAGAVLAELARRNVFLHRHGRQAGTYRYHSLFRTFLQAELARERPNEVRGAPSHRRRLVCRPRNRHRANQACDRSSRLAADGASRYRCVAATRLSRAPGNDPQAVGHDSPRGASALPDVVRPRCDRSRSTRRARGGSAGWPMRPRRLGPVGGIASHAGPDGDGADRR